MQKTGFLICWHIREWCFKFSDKVITPKNDRGVENPIAGGKTGGVERQVSIELEVRKGCRHNVL